MTEFVEGWSIMQTLGEGSYGEVKLLFNQNTGSAVAMKIIDLIKHPNAPAAVRKEAHIHNLLSHDNIISYYGQRQDQNYVYMFIEYVSGGELFDRIEPDVGMPQAEAQKYFKQLISGVEYLHEKGVAHRDLKPENLLLDQYGNLKISDFGMATFFRIQEKERMLQNQCGTLPYIAPEVLEKPHFAEPADIWSCGIILVALLAGELPWDKPTEDCAEYLIWKNSKKEYMQMTPWSKISTLSLSLIRKILVPTPTARYSIQNIKCHRWYNESFPTSTIPMDVVDNITEDNIRRNLHLRKFDCDAKLCYSQPEEISIKELHYNRECPGLYSFSQPTQIENLLISTQLLSSQSTSFNTNCLQKLVRRMTRFFVKTSVKETISYLTVTVQKLNYSWKSYSDGVITVSTIDRRKSILTFKINILIMEENTLLDFRLSKGCGLEFKRCFVAIKRELQDLVIKGSSINFLNYV